MSYRSSTNRAHRVELGSQLMQAVKNLLTLVQLPLHSTTNKITKSTLNAIFRTTCMHTDDIDKCGNQSSRDGEILFTTVIGSPLTNHATTPCGHVWRVDGMSISSLFGLM
ncbi:hypothetical protein GCK32_011937 [Trichostrongylus colubriformis]|uniref:Uncharacterized protein n=1 Tax=Trichostrongylus colubriformis TaxID=6319 RepID=A0AAN8EY92_TRICO